MACAELGILPCCSPRSFFFTCLVMAATALTAGHSASRRSGDDAGRPNGVGAQRRPDVGGADDRHEHGGS